MDLSIDFGDQISLGRFEKLMESNFVNSKKAKTVVFNLESLNWIGHFPAILLYSWATFLIQKNVDISFRLRDRAQLTPQVRKAMLEYGILSELSAHGADVPYHSSPNPRDGLKLKTLQTIDILDSELERGMSATMSFNSVRDSARDTIVDAFETILFELAENTFIHTNGAFPHFQVSVATSAGAVKNALSSQGLMAVFDPGTDYVEICIGDLGPGIQSKLKRYVPDDFTSPFSASLLNPERILSYAFEFGSTSDEDGRRQRLEELLAGRGVDDPAKIATGLFCVFETARSKGGQLVTRTPSAYLSFDFTRGRRNPRISGRRDLGISRLASLPGTHYLLRLPLSATTRQRTQIVQKLSTSVPEVQFLHAFKADNENESPRSLLDAINKVQRFLSSERNKDGLVFILPSIAPISSRAIAIFLGLLRSLPHGKKTLFWLEPRAQLVLENSNISSKRLRFGGQPVLVGDLITNTFAITDFSGADNIKGVDISASRSHGALEPRAFAISQDRYAQELAVLLTSILTSGTVRQQPGPFLIEGKYYTDTFFQIENAIKNAEQRRLFTNWFLLQLSSAGSDNLPEILLAADPHLNSFTVELANLIEAYFGYCPDVVRRDDRLSALSVLRDFTALSARGKRLLVITDVICTADRIKETLLAAQSTDVSRVFAFIDARSKIGQGEPLILKENRTLPIESILQQTIEPHQQCPSVPSDDSETVYVIDRQTHSPTQYIRGEAPKYAVEELLESHIKESDALAHGHFESGEKHYSYYLHFPRLFASMQLEIESWVASQVNAVSQITRSELSEQWHGLVFNPDGSLSWLPTFLESIRQAPKISIVTTKQLSAPPAPRPFKKKMTTDSASNHWIVVLPAIASGETTRRIIEFVSRSDPSSILVLCVASRMDARNVSFLRQIRKYGNAELRFSCFFEFPFGSYNRVGGKCPYCEELSELQRLLRMSQSLVGESSVLASAIQDKISTATAITVNLNEGEKAGIYQRSSVTMSHGARQRVRIRSLYERAKYDTQSSRKKLNKLLINSQEHVDHLLRIISSDRMGREFTIERLRQRLFKSYDLLIARALSILDTAEPPFPIGLYINAFLHLIPDSFNERACELMTRYIKSFRDIEEICLGLVRYGLMPAERGSLLSRIRDDAGASSVHKLANETFELLEKLARPNDIQIALDISNLSALWADFKRSNLYSTGIEYLKEHATDSAAPVLDLQERLRQVIYYWNMSLSPLISKVRLGVWKNVASDHDRGFSSFARLEQLMARLSSLSKSEVDETLSETHYRQELDEVTTDLDMLVHELADWIREYFVNPLNCSAADRTPLDYGAVYGDDNGIDFTAEIDRHTDTVFCDLGELNFICDEMTTNWIKHGQSAMDPAVVFCLKDLKDFVELRFRDNFPGRFDMASTGGLKAAKDFCEKFGGFMGCTDPDKRGFKTVSLFLRKIPRGIDRTNTENV